MTATALVAEREPVRPDAYASTDAHRQVADQLRERLLIEQVQPGDATPRVRRTQVALYRPDGRFDRAVCRLHLNRRGRPRFLALTLFYRDDTLVACVSQEGALHEGAALHEGTSEPPS